MMVGFLPAEQISAYILTYNLASLNCSSMQGVSTATAILVGESVGEKNLFKARL